ncbi:MAG TPA: PepSY domain-containing protein [Enterococcus columbae]|nr:PepSY domain-containing protein [Enterococcus columbae]
MKNKYLLAGISMLSISLLAGCSGSDTSSDQSTSQPQNTSSSISQSTSATDTSDTASQENGKRTVSVEDAIKAFQDTYPGADITSLELDTSFGKYFYKVEGVDDSKEYEIRVDGETKKIEKEREESLDDDEKNGEKRKDKLALTDLLSIEKAASIAEKEVGSGQATDWDLDQELGTTYWEVTVEDNGTETNVKMDARTGEILEKEVDD